MTTDNYQWMDHANCQTTLEFDQLTHQQKQVFCDNCPVKKQCHTFETLPYTTPGSNRQKPIPKWSTNPTRSGPRGGILAVGGTCKNGHLIRTEKDLRRGRQHDPYPACAECTRIRARANYAKRKQRETQ